MTISFWANHLWQSTLFAVGAALLTLVLRNNGAHTRYWVWFAVTVKFLVPFSLLVAAGNQIPWRSAAVSLETVDKSSTGVEWMDVVDKIARPIGMEESVTLLSPGQERAAAVSSPLEVTFNGVDLPTLLIVVWTLGFLTVMIYWLARWVHLRSIVRAAQPLTIACLPVLPIEIKSSAALLEPGVVGIFKPLLLVPEGIQKRLSIAQLQAIVAHELSHLRRRDNLTAAIHMWVEMLFWFHPLVWWIGARLIDERERACDEAVLKFGNNPEAYAEGILNVCEFYAASPLDCAAGVSGADLKKRIEFIARNKVMDTVHFVKKIILGLLTVVVVVGPVVLGMLTAPVVYAQTPAIDPSAPSFSTATIAVGQEESPRKGLLVNPDGKFTTINWPLSGLIAFAYNVQESEIDGPSDQLAITYNISAQAAEALPKNSSSTIIERYRLMVRRLLAERFRLVFHNETKHGQVLALTGGSSAALKPAKAGDPGPFLGRGQNSINCSAIEIDLLVQYLARQLKQPIVDQTGLTGTYNFKLKFGPEQGDAGAPTGPQPDPSKEVLTQTLQEQLGLILVAQDGDVRRLVVDKVLKPSDVVPPRVEIKLDPAVFDDKYAGYYDFAPNRVITVYRDDDRFMMKLTGQPAVQVYAEGEHKFFAKTVDGHSLFVVDANNNVTELTVWQDGGESHSPRMSEAAAKLKEDAFEKRVSSKTAALGSEAAVRKHIASLQADTPNYDDLSPGLADAVRKQWPGFKSNFLEFGKLKSVTFRQVGPGGADIYDVEFENAKTEWRIAMVAGDPVKVQSLGFRKITN